MVATRPISAGEVIMCFEGKPHTLVTREWVERKWVGRERDWFNTYAWPISDQVWATWPEDPEEWRPINHSCDPNAWLEGLNLVARCAIEVGEEIRIDYATYGNNILAPFDCDCGASACRGRVKEDDHLQPFLEAYGDHVSEFVREKRAQSK